MTEVSVEAASQNIFDALSRVGFEGADVLIADELAAYRAAVQHGCAEKVRAQAQGYICPCGCGDCFGQSACEDLADLLEPRPQGNTESGPT